MVHSAAQNTHREAERPVVGYRYRFSAAKAAPFGQPDWTYCEQLPWTVSEAPEGDYDVDALAVAA